MNYPELINLCREMTQKFPPDEYAQGYAYHVAEDWASYIWHEVVAVDHEIPHAMDYMMRSLTNPHNKYAAHALKAILDRWIENGGEPFWNRGGGDE